MEKQVKHYFRTGFSQAGTIVAFVLSWCANHSVLWGIIHGCLGWFYIVYWALKYSHLEEWIKEVLMK